MNKGCWCCGNENVVVMEGKEEKEKREKREKRYEGRGKKRRNGRNEGKDREKWKE